MSIIIVGCGVFGLSAALELAEKGYKVTALDSYPVPSAMSAANDLNKIIRTEYSDLDYTKLAIESLKQWRENPTYKDNYFECGRFTLSPADAANASRSEFEQKGIDNLRKLGDKADIKTVLSKEELSALIPELKESKLVKVNGKFNPEAGYGHSANSLKSVYSKCLELGVTFKFGKEGKVVEISDDESVITESNDEYTADSILVCNGASAGYIIDLEDQVHSLGVFITHIKLSPQEYEKYHKIPIFFSSELGYFFPPDPETHKMKIALTYADATNEVSNPFLTGHSISLPRYKSEFKGDTMPVNGAFHVRKLLDLVVPDLSNHELIESKCCWVGDTVGSNFIIDNHPSYSKVWVAVGDSGHAFKFMPIIGKYIVDRIENKLESPWKSKWEWKSYPEWPKSVSWRTKREHFEMKDINFYKEGKSKL